MVEHVNIEDADRHEVKHASTALANQILVANGTGGTGFRFLSYNELSNLPSFKGYVPVLYASSAAANQQPTALNTAMQVEFGGAQDVGSVSLASNGTLTFKQAGQYFVEFILRFGRTGTTGSSVLMSRVKINDAPLNKTLSATLGVGPVLNPATAILCFDVVANTTFKIELIRDGSGTNDGGLIATTPTASGWDISPSASLFVSKFTGVV